VLPVLHEALELALNENDPPPEILDAKVEIFLFTSGLPQIGQVTSSVALAERTSSSKGCSQSVHTNSKSGILISSIWFVWERLRLL